MIIDNADDGDNDVVPWYEAEDIGCLCTEDGIESEWEWDPTQSCYICAGCGEPQ